MKFSRLAVIEFIGLNAVVTSAALNQGDQIRVELSRLQNAPEPGNFPYMAIATASQLGNTDIRLGELTLDQQMRLDCEYFIATAATSVAVSYGCQSKVWSFSPAYALQAESPEDAAKLATLKVYPHEMNTRFPVPWTGTKPDTYIDKLMDRLEGAAVMAECMNNTTYLGRYRECIRLFELAFKRATPELEKPLWQFLEPAPPRYSRAEVKDWLSFRNRSMHADKKESTSLAFERDVQRFMDRMRQAAQDVLFNKARWHESSTERRKLWQPLAAVLANGGLQCVHGFPYSTKPEFMDCFFVWPLSMANGFSQPPPGFWMPRHDVVKSAPLSIETTPDCSTQ
jgi:hypothetical protein